MKLTSAQLKDILVRPGYVSEEDFNVAVKTAEERERVLAEVLVDKKLIKDEELGQLIAQSLGVPFVNLHEVGIDEGVFMLVPESVAESRGVVAFARSRDEVKVGMVDPDDDEMKQLLVKRFGVKVKPYYMTRRDLRYALEKYHTGFREKFTAVLDTLASPDLSREKKDALIVRLLDIILEYGHHSGASDIHIEPLSGRVSVRFRIDGVMHEVFRLPREFLDNIIARIKILAKMRIDEHQGAQDGKFRFTVRDIETDVRVSIVPVTRGENTVLRLLSAQNRRMSLDELGFSETGLTKIRKIIKDPHGLILVVGPTGSGKTTTIYEVIKVLNKPEVNIASIEDPVEYDMEGVSQIQVNPKTNLTFAQGLRAIVRQDPDIIVVGEIRDAETAKIAVNSAMTGHQVLSTVHANDAATTLPRLLEMDIEPYLVVSTVNAIIAQRLVRKICLKCRYSAGLDERELGIINAHPALRELLVGKSGKEPEKITVFRGAGCPTCSQIGYSGRIGIFEILELSPGIEELVLRKASSDEITAAARQDGMSTMTEDGIDKVLFGVTTLSEVLRVIME